ncbi:MAG: NAD(P)-dependent dehydrogenase (short-subunit alcohol dehydrogenase family) [Gammaproteobacteria bacterium]|jgi:NAD(P)-dependent dehydrogenase (short-subunit alcohol dehydrogenase family)
MFMKKLEGKTALVTGGRQGIGRAIVDKLVEDGAQVLTCGRGERPDDLPESILWETTDVAIKVDIDILVKRAKHQFGQLSILINNAGIQIEKTILETSDEDYDNLMGINAKAVFMLCRDCIPFMSKAGAIINIGSISASTADPGLAIYNASKSFVQGLTRSIAVDHGPDIRCNAISPGWIMTGMADAAFAVAKNLDLAKKDALARHPAGRFGKPEDIANLTAWLASDEASFATGQCYTLDGGMTAASPLNPSLF